MGKRQRRRLREKGLRKMPDETQGMFRWRLVASMPVEPYAEIFGRKGSLQ
jgi:hypothetical protein